MQNTIKRIILSVTAALFLVSFIGYTTAFSQEQTSAAQTNNQAAQEYVLLQPLPSIGSTTNASDGIGPYINQLFTLSLGLGAVLAVIMIAIGGLQYMGTDVFSKKGEARSRITNALLGLLLIILSSVLLATINPEILNVDVEIKTVTTKGFIPDFDSLLNAENVDEYLAQQQRNLDELERVGASVAGCDLGGNWVNSPTIDLQNNREAAVAVIKEQISGCGLERALDQSKYPSRHYSECTTATATIGGKTYVKSCYLKYKSVSYQECGPNDCVTIGKGSAENDIVIRDRGHVCKQQVTSCQIGKELYDKKLLIQQDTPLEERTWITEGHPPTITHRSGCHQDRTCVDENFIDGKQDPQRIMDHLIRNYNGGLFAEYESRDTAVTNEVIRLLQESAGTESDYSHLTARVLNINVPPHFSVYLSEADSNKRWDYSQGSGG